MQAGIPPSKFPGVVIALLKLLGDLVRDQIGVIAVLDQKGGAAEVSDGLSRALGVLAQNSAPPKKNLRSRAKLRKGKTDIGSLRRAISRPIRRWVFSEENDYQN